MVPVTIALAVAGEALKHQADQEMQRLLREGVDLGSAILESVNSLKPLIVAQFDRSLVDEQSDRLRHIGVVLAHLDGYATDERKSKLEQTEGEAALATFRLDDTTKPLSCWGAHAN